MRGLAGCLERVPEVVVPTNAISFLPGSRSGECGAGPNLCPLPPPSHSPLAPSSSPNLERIPLSLSPVSTVSLLPVMPPDPSPPGTYPLHLKVLLLRCNDLSPITQPPSPVNLDFLPCS